MLILSFTKLNPKISIQSAVINIYRGCSGTFANCRLIVYVKGLVASSNI